MRFGKGALGAAVALACTLLSSTSAFTLVVPHITVHQSQKEGLSLVGSRLKRKSVASSTTGIVSPWNQQRLSSRRSLTQRKLAEQDDDDEVEDEDYDEPLAKGIDSVSWLPSVKGAKNVEVSGAQEGTEILPLFPLGGIVYTPNSEHVLNIFEPRYRQMYNDILMNGTKRFVVSMSHPTEQGRFAQTGVLFELEELKEVSEQTADQIKYICNHKVTGRVHINRVLNPEVWESRETYLMVEGVVKDDSGRDKENKDDKAAPEEKKDEAISNDVYGAVADAMGNSMTKPEKEVRDSFADLVEIQHELEEDVRFTKASVISLAVKPGPGKDGLWQTVRLWQSFADQRLMARQNDLQKDFQEKLQEFLKKEKGLKDEEIPSAIGFQDLSPALQQEVQELQKRMAVELQPLVLESTLTMQKLLEAEDHEARCRLLKYFIDAEKKRLTTKKALAGMFSGDTAGSSSIPAEEQLTSRKDNSDETDDNSTDGSKSIYTDEPDAWG